MKEPKSGRAFLTLTTSQTPEESKETYRNEEYVVNMIRRDKKPYAWDVTLYKRTYDKDGTLPSETIGTWDAPDWKFALWYATYELQQIASNLLRQEPTP